MREWGTLGNQRALPVRTSFEKGSEREGRGLTLLFDNVGADASCCWHGKARSKFKASAIEGVHRSQGKRDTSPWV